MSTTQALKATTALTAHLLQAGGIAALAQIVKNIDTQRISALLQSNTLQFPDKTKAAETLSAALRESRKNQADLYIPSSEGIPYGTYVNRDGAIYFKTK